MKKKEAKTFRPKQVRENRLSTASMVAQMRELGQIPAFQTLQAEWLNVHAKILREGMENPSVEQWHTLRGFYMAAMAQENWAAMKTGEDVLKQRQERLLAELNGGK